MMKFDDYSRWPNDHAVPFAHRHVVLVVEAPRNRAVAGASFLTFLQLFEQFKTPRDY